MIAYHALQRRRMLGVAGLVFLCIGIIGLAASLMTPLDHALRYLLASAVFGVEGIVIAICRRSH